MPLCDDNDVINSEDSYEPEYEVQAVHVTKGLTLHVSSLLPPPIEYLSHLHKKRQEISGRQVWTGSLMLARWIIAQHDAAMMRRQNEFAGHRVLELGSGTGVLGMTVSRLCQPLITIVTDGDQQALELLQANLERPCNYLDYQSSIKAAYLPWGTDGVADFGEICRSMRPDVWSSNDDDMVLFDEIVAGDVLYKQELPTLFFETVQSLLQPHGVLWLCHVHRSSVTQTIVQERCLAAGFCFEVCKKAELNHQSTDNDDEQRAVIYLIRKRGEQGREAVPLED